MDQPQRQPLAPHSLANDRQSAIASLVAESEAKLIALRRDIHAHPELGFEEQRTAGIVARELRRIGITPQTQVGRTGVVGVIRGGRPGPTLAIRADMDALPIHEQTGLPFASTVAGKMHACGHDIHTTTLLGVAEVLHRLAPQLAGTVRLLFQPAEEILGGAAAMIADGALEGVDMALAFHNQPDMPTGQFGFVRGACLAASDLFDITVHGLSGHAAHPQGAIDPIVAAAHLVAQLQTVVSREVPPMQPAVVTVGAIHAGTVHNIIPDQCLIRGTVRTLQPQTRSIAEAAIRRLCAGLEAGMRTRCDIHYVHGVPPLVNDDHVLELTVAAVRRQFGEDAVAEFGAVLGGEDFAFMAERVPAFQLRVGSSQPGRHDRLHHSGYQPDEACIGLGAQALARAALDMLS